MNVHDIQNEIYFFMFEHVNLGNEAAALLVFIESIDLQEVH